MVAGLPGGPEIAGSGLSATLRDFARFGQFYLDGGKANGQSVLPDGWMQEASVPKVPKGGANLDYGYMWWIATSDKARADKAFMARGIFGQYIYINPKERVIIAMTKCGIKASKSPAHSSTGIFRRRVRCTEIT